MMRRILSLMLAMLLVVGMLPTAALATGDTASEPLAETAPAETAAPAAETAASETEAPAAETTVSAEETSAPVTEAAEESDVTEAAEETAAATEPVVEENSDAQADPALAASGTCGETMTWAIAEGVLTISGTGEMEDYGLNAASPWRDIAYAYTAIVVEEGITTIGDHAFDGLVSVAEITLPNSLTAVGAYSFAQMVSLQEVIFPDGLLSIGENAFSDCENLTIHLPASLIFISEDAFAFSYGLVVNYAGTLEQWQEIYEGTDEVTVNCEDHTVDPSTQPLTGKCGENLTWSLDKETGVLTISGTGEMYDYDTENKSPWHDAGITVTGLVVEEGVTTIGDYAFAGMSGLTEVTLPGSVVSIGDYAFAYCPGLTKVTVSEGTQTIGENAFAECGVLARVTVPASVETIAPTAFSGSTTYLTVDYAGTEEQWPEVYTGPAVNVSYPPAPPVTSGTCGEGLTWSVSEDGVLTISGTGEMASFDAVPWNNTGVEITSVVVEGGVTSIGGNAFAGMTGITSVTLPETLVNIDANAFASCSGLTEITIPASVAGIGGNAFADCESLGTITFLGSAPVIDGTAFTGVTAEVNYPQTDKSWSADVRLNYGGDLSWNTPDIIEKGETSNGLTWTLDETGELIIEGDGTTVPDNAFAGNTEVKTVVLPDSVTTIGDGAFEGCTNLEDINLGGITELGENCFKDCDALVIIDLSMNPVVLRSQKTQLTYKAPDAVKAENIRWEVLSTTAESHTDLDALTGELHLTHKAVVIVRCKDARSGAQTSWNLQSEYVPVIVEPVLEEGSPASARMLTEDAEIAANGKQLSKYALYLDKEDVASGTYTFDIRVSCADGELDLSDIKFTSTNTKVATIKGNTVTVKKKADGAAVILAQVKDGKNVVAEGMLSIYVREYTPRLDETTFTLNTLMTSASVTTGLVESYGNLIKADTVKLTVYDKSAKDYVETTALTPVWENGKLTITANGELAKGTIKARLSLTCHNSEMDLDKDYTFDLKITVKNTAPAITTKQGGKFNLFYTDSTAALTVTAKNAVVTGAALADCDFILENVDGVYTVKYAPTYDSTAKADTKGTLLVTLAGYTKPVEKAVTISTVTTNPKLALTAASSVINTALNDDPITGFAVYDTTTGEFLVKDIIDIDCDFATAAIYGLDTEDYRDDAVILTLTGEAGGTATVEVKAPNWTQSVQLTHKVTVNTMLPTVKLNVSTLELNSIFTQRGAAAFVALDQSNVTVETFSAFECSAAEAAKISVSYTDGAIVAQFKDTSDLPKAGTYTFKGTPYLKDGTALEEVTVKVKVATTVPSVKLSASTLKLNKALPDEFAPVTYKVTKGDGYTLNYFIIDGDMTGLDSFIDHSTSTVSVYATEGTAEGSRKLTLYPVFTDNVTGQQVTLEKGVKLTVKVYDTTKITVSVSSKGKLDAIVPDSAIVYTVKKISNAIGKIDAVSLYGQDADKFNVALEEVDGKQTFRLTMKENSNLLYSTKVTYKVGFRLSICGYEFDGPEKTFKVTQSKLKFGILPKVARYYQSQSGPLESTITVTMPEGATLASVSVDTSKTAEAFLRSLGNGNLFVGDNEFKATVAEDGRTVTLRFNVRNSGHLTPGKSFPVVLNIIPYGNCSNVAPTQLKLTVKAYK